jgi:hypothetical protein
MRVLGVMQDWRDFSLALRPVSAAEDRAREYFDLHGGWPN